MSRQLSVLCIAFAMMIGSGAIAGGAPAQLLDRGAVIEDVGGSVQISVDLSKPVAWKTHTLATPARLIIDFAEVDWSRSPDVSSAIVSDIRVGRFRPGWSRMVILLSEPLAVDIAEMQTMKNGEASLSIVLRPTTAEDFRAGAGAPDVDRPESAALAQTPSNGRIRVALDPGHGGIDPGAENSGLVEADLMLAFARALKERLLRSGRFEVVLTREEDVFVPLEERVGIAQAAQADVFISLHADALQDGAVQTSGMTAYTLSDAKTDIAAKQLAERHAANEILSGVDLTGAGDDVALALIDLAQRDTTPRSEALARSLVAAIESIELETNSRPHRHGGFSVLKSPEIPSVLLELGYLSHPADRERLQSQDWHADAEQAVLNGILLWWDEDRLRGGALRR